MSLRRPPQSPVAPVLHPSVPHGHGGASTLLRMGLRSLPRPAPATQLFSDRPLLLQQRAPSTQLDLFSLRGSR